MNPFLEYKVKAIQVLSDPLLRRLDLLTQIWGSLKEEKSVAFLGSILFKPKPLKIMKIIFRLSLTCFNAKLRA